VTLFGALKDVPDHSAGYKALRTERPTEDTHSSLLPAQNVRQQLSKNLDVQNEWEAYPVSSIHYSEAPPRLFEAKLR